MKSYILHIHSILIHMSRFQVVLVVIYLARNLGSYVMVSRGKGNRSQRVVGVLPYCLHFFLFTSDYSRLWFIYLLSSLFNEYINAMATDLPLGHSILTGRFNLL